MTWPPHVPIPSQLTEGDIEGFGSINIELVFNPTAIGRYTAEFSLTFSHPSVQPVSIFAVKPFIAIMLCGGRGLKVTITAQGEGSDLPIFVEQEVMDFHICMLDRPYQDCLAITNRLVTSGDGRCDVYSVVPLCHPPPPFLSFPPSPCFLSFLQGHHSPHCGGQHPRGAAHTPTGASQAGSHSWRLLHLHPTQVPPHT